MHRSAGTTRASDEFIVNMSPQGRGSPGIDELPTYEPQSAVSKKESFRLKSAENAIHFIPIVLIICFFILWFFSHPAVDVGNKGRLIVSRIEGLTLDGYTNQTHTGLLDTKTEELESLERILDDVAEKSHTGLLDTKTEELGPLERIVDDVAEKSSEMSS